MLHNIVHGAAHILHHTIHGVSMILGDEELQKRSLDKLTAKEEVRFTRPQRSQSF